jgi:hypothetical protein
MVDIVGILACVIAVSYSESAECAKDDCEKRQHVSLACRHENKIKSAVLRKIGPKSFCYTLTCKIDAYEYADVQGLVEQILAAWVQRLTATDALCACR